MCAKYELLPVELGLWTDSKLYNEGPEGLLDTKESVAKLVQDIKLGNRLGFTRIRAGVILPPGCIIAALHWQIGGTSCIQLWKAAFAGSDNVMYSTNRPMAVSNASQTSNVKF